MLLDARYSGLKYIDKQAAIKVLDKLNEMANKYLLDKELSWMLPYYLSVCEWYLDVYVGLESLLVVSQKNMDLWVTEIHNSSFDHRGQLGDYWNSVSKTH